MFYSIVDKNSEAEVGKYSTEDAALRAGINALRLLNPNFIGLNITKTALTLSISRPIPLEYVISEAVSRPPKSAGLKTEGDRPKGFVFFGRPSSSGWYRSMQVDELDGVALRASGLISYVDGVYSAILIDAAGKPLAAYRLPALEEAARRGQGTRDRAGIDVGLVARDLAAPGMLPETPPDNAVALFVVRSNGLIAKTLYKRYAGASEGFLPPIEEAEGNWLAGRNFVALKGSSTTTKKSATIEAVDKKPRTKPKPVKNSVKPKAVVKPDPRQGTLSLGRTPDNIPLSTKPYSAEEKAELERKFREENGG